MAESLSGPKLEKLPDAVQLMARATMSAGRNLVADSIESSLANDSAAPWLLAIRRSALQLRIFMANEREQIIFFGIKKKRTTLRLIDASLSFSLCAIEDNGELPPVSDHVSYRLLAPPHWVLHPTDAELRRHAPPPCASAGRHPAAPGPKRRARAGHLQSGAGR